MKMQTQEPHEMLIPVASLNAMRIETGMKPSATTQLSSNLGSFNQTWICKERKKRRGKIPQITTVPCWNRKLREEKKQR